MDTLVSIAESVASGGAGSAGHRAGASASSVDTSGDDIEATNASVSRDIMLYVEAPGWLRETCREGGEMLRVFVWEELVCTWANG